jgi:hypothetical protein
MHRRMPCGSLNTPHCFLTMEKSSCNFDTGRTHAGIEKYVCKYDFFERYPQLIHTEVNGEWSVHDEEWLQFASEIFSETKSPFCAVIFTLSSHFPFKFPAKYKGTFSNGGASVAGNDGVFRFRP